MTEADLVEVIYDAAIAPSLWPRVLEILGQHSGGVGASLLRQNQVTGRGEGVYSRPDWAAKGPVAFEYYGSRNPLLYVDDPHAFMRDWQPRLLSDEEWIDKSDLKRTEFYNDFLAPLEIDSLLFVRLTARDLDHVVINVCRSPRQGRFESHDMERVARIHPHLIRAFRLSCKLAWERSARETLGDVIEHSDHAVLIVTQDGRVEHANPAAEALLARNESLRVFGGRLVGPTPDATDQLRRLFARATSNERNARAGGTGSVTSPGRRFPLSVTVAPLNDAALPLPDRHRRAMVCVTDLEAPVNVPEARLRELFGLTAAETKVALGLLTGSGPREIAEEIGVSFNTVRTHLARVLAKTGTRRQGELIRVLMRASQDPLTRQ